MDKYEFNIKIEQIKRLMKKKDYISAVKIADSIDWEKVKQKQLLIMAADVYEIAGKYDDARDVLLLAYERTGLGRQLAYRLCRLSVKRGDFAEAEEFYEEFVHNSPRDAGKYILSYEISKGRGESVEKQILMLEAYIEEDMDDRWAYELAKLYHRARYSEKCVEMCDTIILWFAEGKYVEKAMELKQVYVPLSESQRIKYEAQKSKKKEVEEIIGLDAEEEIELPLKISVTVEKVAKEKLVNEKKKGDILDEVHEADIDVNDIHVKDYSGNNKYDTVNLQKELAKSVSSLFDNTIEIFKPGAKKETVSNENEVKSDDQIEGQMKLEEVLAMFESGEFQSASDSNGKKLSVEDDKQIITDDVSEIYMEIEDEIIASDDVVEAIDTEAIDTEAIDTEEIEAGEIEAEEIKSEELNSEEIDMAGDALFAQITAREMAEKKAEEAELKRAGVQAAEQVTGEDTVHESQTEEDSEAAESESLEKNVPMYDLKAEAAKDKDVEAAEDVKELNEKKVNEKKAPARTLIPSDAAKEELKNFIARFAGVQGLDKQILKVMQNTLKVEQATVKFIFVKGEVKSGKTTLAIEVLKLANKLMQRRDQRIAKIKAENINGKSVTGLLSKLDGSDVLVEKVSDMNIDTFVEFIDAIKEEGRERIVIFEDEKSLADAFLEKVPESHATFKNILDIRQNKIKDWTEMAKIYAESKGYAFDEMGTLALSAKIDQLRAITLVVHKDHIEQIVDSAIKHRNRFRLSKLLGRGMGKNEDGLKLLTEKNFDL